MSDFICALAGLETPINLPCVLDFRPILPKARGEACEISRPQSRGLDYLRAHNRDVKDISLKLHQEII